MLNNSQGSQGNNDLQTAQNAIAILIDQISKARGRAKNLKGDKTGAFEDLKKSLELNPEGEEAQKMNGQHSNFDNMYKGGIF